MPLTSTSMSEMLERLYGDEMRQQMTDAETREHIRRRTQEASQRLQQQLAQQIYNPAGIQEMAMPNNTNYTVTWNTTSTAFGIGSVNKYIKVGTPKKPEDILKPYEERVASGLLRKVISPDGKLVLYNYTDKCTFDRAWDEYTLAARGIIFELATGKVIAKPFPKFFNLGEHESTKIENLPKSRYRVMEKMDGSLGIVYYWDKQWRVATRGSFTSDQAVKATELLKKYNLKNGGTCSDTWTMLVEIIYPENRVVVDYGTRAELVLLEIWGGSSFMSYADVTTYGRGMGMPVAERYEMTVEECLADVPRLSRDQEGFVLWYPDESLRVKIKGSEYLKIAKLLAHMSPIAIWETMVDLRVPNTYLEQLPEEFRPQFEPIVAELEKQAAGIRAQVELDIKSLPVPLDDFRGIGLYLASPECVVKYPKLVFTRLRTPEKLDEAIHKLIRPDGNELRKIE